MRIHRLFAQVLFLALLAVALPTAARHSRGGVALLIQPLGINLQGPLSYYTVEQPFNNIVKSAYSSSQWGGWYTNSTSGTTPAICPGTSGYFDTCEEGYLATVLDANGYPTTLTVAGIPGGQIFNEVTTLLNASLPAVVTGQTYTYPPGTYRLKFEGKGTVTISGDGTATLSNAAANTYVTTTFTVTPTTGGMHLNITAVNSNTDYPRDISVVLNSQAAAYDAGAIFSPQFLAEILPYSAIRFMEWKATNGEFYGVSTGQSTISSGATSMTMSSPWGGPTLTQTITFPDGEQRTASFTVESSTVSWTGGLTNGYTAASNWTWASRAYYNPFVVTAHTWAQRAQPANAFWVGPDGVPLEVVVALCNQLAIACYVNVPMGYSDSDMQAMAQLVMSGTGMQSGYVGLNGGLAATFELSNEVWNGSYTQSGYAASLGATAWPGQSSGGFNATWEATWYGMRTAQMSSNILTAVGSTIFNRVTPVLGTQIGNTGEISTALGCSYWSGAPCSGYHIKAVADAPYWGTAANSTDCTNMTAQADGGLGYFFQGLTSNVITGGSAPGTYSSIPSGGWLSSVETSAASDASYLATNYPTLKLIAYEGGPGWLISNSGSCSGWSTLVTAAERDARMGTALTAYLNWWKANVGATAANMDYLFNDADPLSANSGFGILESPMQAISPITSAPAKYQGVINYAR